MPEPAARAGVRLNKFLASCGLGSRRACEQIVAEGRVEINGAPCLNLATRVLASDAVRVDGRLLRTTRETTLLLNKPRDVLTTRHDPGDRPTVYRFLPPKFHHLPHVGRLDRDSEGLILFSNAAGVSEKLTHPRHAVEKEYLVNLDRPFDPHLTEKFLAGVHTPEGLARTVSVHPLSKRRVVIVLRQGLKRQIRLMFEAFDYRVRRLVRTRIGSLEAPDLPPGKFKLLNPAEVRAALTNPVRSRRRERD